MSDIKPFINNSSDIQGPGTDGFAGDIQATNLEQDDLVMYEKALVSLDGAIKEMYDHVPSD